MPPPMGVVSGPLMEMRRSQMCIRDRAHADLLKLIEEKPNFTKQSMNGILVAKNLERIADHASNIATDVIFWIRGADVRHQLSMSMD